MDDYLFITEATEEDLQDVVEVHQLSFPGFFLSKLGSDFIRSYYKEILRYEHGHFLVAKKSGHVVGFVTGFEKPQVFYKKLLLSAKSFFVPLVFAILRCPSIALLITQKIVNLLRYLYSKRNDSKTNLQRRTELSSLAVHPSVQGQGIGSQLVQIFIQNCFTCSPVIIYLTTDAEDNEEVNRFYCRLGFDYKGNVDSESGRVMNKYELFIAEAA